MSQVYTKGQTKLQYRKDGVLVKYTYIGTTAESNGVGMWVINCEVCDVHPNPKIRDFSNSGNFITSTSSMNRNIKNSRSSCGCSAALERLGTHYGVDFYEGTSFIYDKTGAEITLGRKLKGKYKALREYHCSICSKDRELHPKPFLIGIDSLNTKKVNCGCTRFNWNYSQYKILCERVLKGTSSRLLKFEEPYNKRATCCILSCSHHGEYKCAAIDSLLSGNHTCPVCLSEDRSLVKCNGNGYYPARSEEEDYLYISEIGGVMKVGRSFSPKERNNSFKSKAGSKARILSLWKGKHGLVWSTEQRLLLGLKDSGLMVKSSWTKETFKHSYKTLSNLESQLKNTNLSPLRLA